MGYGTRKLEAYQNWRPLRRRPGCTPAGTALLAVVTTDLQMANEDQ
jgi:hypothetical protein